MYWLGLDFGTRGARACVIDAVGEVHHEAQFPWPDEDETRWAALWRDALWQLLAGLPLPIRSQLAGIAVDGTSGTVLACDADLGVVHPPLMYHDSRARDAAREIAARAPEGHPAAAASSGLAKVLWLKARRELSPARLFLNQADWLTSLLTETTYCSDFHNALKMGLDLDTLQWPAWVTQLVDRDCLPAPVAPGSRLALLSRNRARYLGISGSCVIHAGTTDAIAAFLAADSQNPGDAVTSLGSTMVVKMRSLKRVESVAHGVYSHWFGAHWLAGGASNCGAAILQRFFDDAELQTLSARIDPAQASPLHYVPLVTRGERFPVHDPDLLPCLEPRPEDDVAFLHGLLESLARREAEGYALLEALGAGTLRRVETAGGGARNPTWQAIRQRLLKVPITPARHVDAAYGTARLSRDGLALFA